MVSTDNHDDDVADDDDDDSIVSNLASILTLFKR